MLNERRRVNKYILYHPKRNKKKINKRFVINFRLRPKKKKENTRLNGPRRRRRRCQYNILTATTKIFCEKNYEKIYLQKTRTARTHMFTYVRVLAILLVLLCGFFFSSNIYQTQIAQKKWYV